MIKHERYTSIILYCCNRAQKRVKDKMLQPSREVFYMQAYNHGESTLSILPFKK